LTTTSTPAEIDQRNSHTEVEFLIQKVLALT